MYIVTTASFLTSVTKDIARQFIRAAATPLPSFLKREHVFTVASGAEGFKTYGIYEVDDGKVVDGIKELAKYYVQFFEYDGFAYKLEPVMPAEEAIPLLGL